MPKISAQSARLRSRLAGAISGGKATPDQLADMRRDFHASALADYFALHLQGAPQLTRDQYDELHSIIRRHQLTGGAR